MLSILEGKQDMELSRTHATLPDWLSLQNALAVIAIVTVIGGYFGRIVIGEQTAENQKLQLDKMEIKVEKITFQLTEMSIKLARIEERQKRDDRK